MKLSIHLLMPLILTGAMAAGQNVGIGTTSPQTRLHVFNGAGPSIMRSESSTLSGEAALELKTANGVFDFLELRKWMPGASGTLAGIALDGLSQITTGSHATGGLLIGNKTARPLYFITDNTERLRITETGRVGIGVSNPTSMLEVDAGPGTETSPASETTIRFKSATEHSIRHWYMMGNNLNTALVIARFGTGIVGTLLGQTMTNLSAIYTNDLGLNALAIGTKNTIPLILGTNNQERLRITGTGKTGINTTNPLYALHVEDPLNTAIYARTRSNSNDTSAIRGVLDNTNGAAARAAGVRGVSNSTNQWSIGVYGTHSGGGWGVAGSVKEAGASGWGAGVYGEAGQGGGPSGTGGFGVYGLNFNTGGTAGFFQDASGTGKALATAGNIQFAGLGAGAGKVLTSDAAGNATWQSLPAGSGAWQLNGNNLFNTNPGYIGINTPTALPNYAQLVVQRGAGAGIGITGEIGAALAINQNVASGSGVYGITTAARSGAIGYAGVTGLNVSTASDRLGVIGISQGITAGTAYSAGVGGYGDYGVLGYSQTTTGAGIIAQHASGRTALELNNGFLKVTGTNRTAYIHTAIAANTSGHITTLGYANPAATDIIIATHNYSGTNQVLNKPFGVYWNGSNWTIYLEDQASSILNQSFNVLVIRQ